MGNDDLFKKRQEVRKSRIENTKKLKSSNWLIVCEGLQTEVNYFKEAVNSINSKIEDKYRLKVKVIGKGMSTISLVNSVDHLINYIDKYKYNVVPYGKIFVVFDKDDFSNEAFNNAIAICEKNGYIPLWSNQSIEYWFLLHFYYIDSKMNRLEYENKINNYFKNCGLNYHYKKNAKHIYSIHANDTPADSESCTTVYKFFEYIDERLNELK